MIATLKSCRVRSSGDTNYEDIRALGVVTMELMQKYAKEDGMFGVDDLQRWPSDSDAVEFLLATTSTTSIDELKTVSLSQCDFTPVSRD